MMDTLHGQHIQIGTFLDEGNFPDLFDGQQFGSIHFIHAYVYIYYSMCTVPLGVLMCFSTPQFNITI